LLNIPPNRDGLLETTDVNAIKKFREILNETFSHNLVSKKHKFLIDKKLSTSKVLDVNQSLILQLEGEKEFDRISIQENIAEGQRIKSFLVEYWDGKTWQKLAESTTVGHKRLLRFPTVKSTQGKIDHQRCFSKGILGRVWGL
jgi:alpha-L-fucosidase